MSHKKFRESYFHVDNPELNKISSGGVEPVPGDETGKDEKHKEDETMTMEDIRRIVKHTLQEVISDHARFAQNSFDSMQDLAAKLQQDPKSIPIRKGKYDEDWIISGKFLGIPEFMNVDIVFRNNEVPEDETYGMYKSSNPTDSFIGRRLYGQTTSKERLKNIPNMPESQRKYVILIPYSPEEKLWSLQRFVRAMPRLLDDAHETWFHEVGHLITARKVPTGPHVKHFFTRGGSEFDYEEIVGTFIQQFEKLYSKYGDRPEAFLQKFPTVEVLVSYLKPQATTPAQETNPEFRFPWGMHANMLLRGRDRKGKRTKEPDRKAELERAEKWFRKRAFQVWQDLGGKK